MALLYPHVVHGPAIKPGSAGESDLVREAASGSPEALAELYRLHAAPLFRLARRLTASTQDAEDMLHDLFVGLPEAIRKYEGRGSLQGWLKRVMVRLALMHLRSRRRRREVALEDHAAARESGQAADDAAGWDLQRAVAKLPDDLRAVLLLRQAEGYSHREIAALLGITPGASRVRFSRAVKILRGTLRGRT